MTTQTLAGMAADCYGRPDGRPPLVLLHGLTFDRRIWHPVLDHLKRLDPDRQVLALDLPGHGESPARFPHSMQHVVDLVRDAVDAAALADPVLVGHSIAGGLASSYAARYPTRGVVNVDAPPNIEPFVAQLQSMSAQIHGPDFPVVWARMEQTFRTDLLPPDVRDLVARNSRPRQEIVVSYWQELLDQSPKQISASISDAMADLAAAGVPYLLVLGSDPTPDLPELLSAYLPYSTLEVWAGTGHFPHLAHPRRFAARLTATGGWPTRSLLHAEAAL